MEHTLSTTRSWPSLAVSVQNASKSYGKDISVLSNLSMKLEQGIIYSLLGASGCGKTTLLSCIVGLEKLDSGNIRLFGSRVNGTPGKLVGYMPQDVSLHSTLSVKETIEYYGCLYGMAQAAIESQWTWLVEFLKLPKEHILIRDLSGGQKRRVSLAVTLVHSPKLLILDEPTVGLDPLLRESIWEHLKTIKESGNRSVIITTHYIEETRASDKIGVLRGGQLLVEESPALLLQRFQYESLEQVVLQLCRAKEAELRIVDYSCNQVSQEQLKISIENIKDVELCTESLDLINAKETSKTGTIRLISALSKVVYLMFLRHPIFIGLMSILPAMQIVMTLVIIGQPPIGLNVGIVNQEISYEMCQSQIQSFSGELEALNFKREKQWSDSQSLSCGYIHELSHSGVISLVPIESEIAAKEQVRSGKIKGYFLFPTNYTKSLIDFAAFGKFAEMNTIDGSKVTLSMDMSDYLQAYSIIQYAFNAYSKFAKMLAKRLHFNQDVLSVPLRYNTPIFGDGGTSYQEYFLPCVILGVLLEIPAFMTSLIIIQDRSQGVLDRARIAGVRFREVMFSHIITQTSVVILQTIIYLIVLYFCFDLHITGSFWSFFIISILGGLCGQAMGFFVGSVFKHEIEAILFLFIIIITIFFSGGCMWPVQGMPLSIRIFSFTLPTTLFIESFRSVMYRGMGFFSNLVWPGVAVSIFWSMLLVSISIYLST